MEAGGIPIPAIIYGQLLWRCSIFINKRFVYTVPVKALFTAGMKGATNEGGKTRRLYGWIGGAINDYNKLHIDINDEIK